MHPFAGEGNCPGSLCLGRKKCKLTLGPDFAVLVFKIMVFLTSFLLIFIFSTSGQQKSIKREVILLNWWVTTAQDLTLLISFVPYLADESCGNFRSHWKPFPLPGNMNTFFYSSSKAVSKGHFCKKSTGSDPCISQFLYRY